MNRFVFGLVVPLLVLLKTLRVAASSGTLVELCQEVCGTVGNVIDGNIYEMPESAQKWIKEQDYLNGDWACSDIKTMVFALAKRGKEKREEGTEGEFSKSLSDTFDAIGEKLMTAVTKNTGQECMDKFFEIFDYLQREVGKF